MTSILDEAESKVAALGGGTTDMLWCVMESHSAKLWQKTGLVERPVRGRQGILWSSHTLSGSEVDW